MALRRTLPGRFQLAATLVAALLLSSAAGGKSPYRYFPLEEGNTWRYGIPDWPWGWEIRVMRREGERVVLRRQHMNFDTGEVDRGPFFERLIDHGNEIDIELPEEGDVSYYRFDEDEFLHRNPSDGCVNGTVEVLARDDVVETPAGIFSPCLRLFFTAVRNCADGGRVEDWWCPEIGLVEWWEQSIGAPHWPLLSFQRHLPRFVRGDVTNDSSLELTDAVSLLLYLFRDGDEPACLDAADTDDNGSLELTDSIFLLRWLFSDAPPPPQPTPSTAGEYPTSDCNTDGTTLDRLGCKELSPQCREGP